MLTSDLGMESRAKQCCHSLDLPQALAALGRRKAFDQREAGSKVLHTIRHKNIWFVQTHAIRIMMLACVEVPSSAKLLPSLTKTGNFGVKWSSWDKGPLYMHRVGRTMTWSLVTVISDLLIQAPSHPPFSTWTERLNNTWESIWNNRTGTQTSFPFISWLCFSLFNPPKKKKMIVYPYCREIPRHRK